MLRQSLQSLAGKLIIAVGVLMALGSLIFGFIFIRYEETIMMKNLISNVSFTADLVKRGVTHGMLTAHRDAIGQTVEVIGSSSEVKGVSIFDKQGKIAYASDKRSIGTIVGTENRTCALCHAGGKAPLETLPESDRWWIETNALGIKTLVWVIPLANEASCYTAECHYHRKEQKVLGVLETRFSTATVDAVIRQNRIGTFIFGVLYLIIFSAALGVILYKLVSKPISLLDKGMREVSEGKDHVIEIQSDDEIGLLASTFNSMSRELKNYKEKMESWTRELEEEVRKKTAENVRAHEQLINAEKLASLGRMAAGVAHELNSPLTGIVTFAHLMLKRIPEESKQDREDIEMIIEQANRCSKIIKSLLGFSRKTTSEKALVDINTLLDSTISMVRNQAKFHNIKFTLTFDKGLPPIAADPNQLQQVFLNLLINASDAMNERGQVAIATRVIRAPLEEGSPWYKRGYPEEAKKLIEIEFADDGTGIADEHLGKVFEPFFTTKPIGKGTGLGLSVTYGIIKKHGGNIVVRSDFGKGATFIIRLPVEEESPEPYA